MALVLYDKDKLPQRSNSADTPSSTNKPEKGQLSLGNFGFASGVKRTAGLDPPGSAPPAKTSFFGGGAGSQPTSQPPSQTQQSVGLFGQQQNQQQQQQGQQAGNMSLFGNSAAKPSLFGNTNTSQPQQTNSLFGNTNTSQPAQTNSLFGNTNTAASQPQQSTSLFGNTNSSQPQQTNSLFGNTATSQPAQTSIFGQTNNQQQPQQQSGGLFGNTATSQPQQSGGLFGQPTTATSQPQQTSLFGQAAPKPSLFGSSTAQPAQQQAQTNNVFGQSAAAPAQQSLFGQPAKPAGTSLFGTSTAAAPAQQSLFGQPTAPAAQQQQQSGVQLDISSLRPTTRFQDLAPPIQAEIENIEKSITQQQEWARELIAQLPGYEGLVRTLPRDVAYLAKNADTLDSILEADAVVIQAAKKGAQKDAEDARLSFGAVDVLKLPPQYRDFRAGGNAFGQLHARQGPPIRIDFPQTAGEQARARREEKGAEDLVGYFNEQVESMGRKMDGLTSTLAQIHGHLGGMESRVAEKQQELMGARRAGRNGTAANGVGGTPEQRMVAQLQRTLLEFEGGLMGVAGRVGEMKEEVEDLNLRKERALLERPGLV